ncbi:uncharacterized protein EV422DRAFT_282159 [Fimicolochytrium jonesii]|uniref:uncharacterized protein n=1 Tax=Fimicolochytrium jonesii TaxID=1396493 RepID=UPI0022FEF8CF|nr:uncharacterized protein EV422DRAFT_282159 [Fimicolochytrium jonesii]KAI8816643.1 hypothetical protein EV422DRAFT_282159 [Fimicolochytrium jonesii]
MPIYLCLLAPICRGQRSARERREGNEATRGFQGPPNPPSHNTPPITTTFHHSHPNPNPMDFYPFQPDTARDYEAEELDELEHPEDAGAAPEISLAWEDGGGDVTAQTLVVGLAAGRMFLDAFFALATGAATAKKIGAIRRGDVEVVTLYRLTDAEGVVVVATVHETEIQDPVASVYARVLVQGVLAEQTILLGTLHASGFEADLRDAVPPVLRRLSTATACPDVRMVFSQSALCSWDTQTQPHSPKQPTQTPLLSPPTILTGPVAGFLAYLTSHAHPTHTYLTLPERTYGHSTPSVASLQAFERVARVMLGVQDSAGAREERSKAYRAAARVEGRHAGEGHLYL